MNSYIVQISGEGINSSLYVQSKEDVAILDLLIAKIKRDVIEVENE